MALTKNNPSVQYFSLQDIVEKTRTNHAVKEVKQEIMKTGVVPAIFLKRKKKDTKIHQSVFITRNTKGPSVWQLMILAELRADGNNDSV